MTTCARTVGDELTAERSLECVSCPELLLCTTEELS
jgi:hypothetical protein